MKSFVVYNPSTGEIQCSGTCQDDDLALQSPLGYVIEGSGAQTTHWVSGGALTAYTPEQAALKSERRFPAVWSNASMSWVDLRTLPERKSAKWASIKQRRSEEEFGGFTWDGSTFDSDPQSQSRIQGAAQLATLAMIASQAFSVDWTLADNTVRTLTGADMLAVGQQMGVHIMTTHATSRALREAIEAATTPEQLESIVWPTA